MYKKIYKILTARLIDVEEQLSLNSRKFIQCKETVLMNMVLNTERNAIKRIQNTISQLILLTNIEWIFYSTSTYYGYLSVI